MKKILIITMIFGMILITGCTKKDNQILNNSGQEIINNENNYDASSMDYMEKYIYQLPNNSARTDFLSFWNSMTSYCLGLEYELKEISNTNNYSFDPTDSSSIPSNLSDLYSFSDIKWFAGYSTHKNYLIVVNGEDVKMSFDGIEFYPTNYGYTEVQKLVEKYNK